VHDGPAAASTHDTSVTGPSELDVSAHVYVIAARASLASLTRASLAKLTPASFVLVVPASLVLAPLLQCANETAKRPAGRKPKRRAKEGTGQVYSGGWMRATRGGVGRRRHLQLQATRLERRGA